MCVAVDFDDERGLGAEEIDDIGAEPDLATEFQTGQLSVAEDLPKAMFGFGGALRKSR